MGLDHTGYMEASVFQIWMVKGKNTEHLRLSNYLTKILQQVSRLWDLAAILCIWRLKEFTKPLRTISTKTVSLLGHFVWFIWPQMAWRSYVIAQHLRPIFVILPYNLN